MLYLANKASSIEVLPDPVGPRIRLSTPRSKSRSPLTRRRNFRWDEIGPGSLEEVLGVEEEELDCASHANVALWKPIA